MQSLRFGAKVVSWWHRFCQGLPMLLLLGLGSAVIQWGQWLDGFDGWFMRRAVESVVLDQHQPGSALDIFLEPQHRVVVLEASTLMRVTELEHSGEGLDQATLDRVGGVRPIDRTKLATVLNELSVGLAKAREENDKAQEPKTQLPTVVVVDIDTAPLFLKSRDRGLIEALTNLRKHVHVVAIVLDRPTREERIWRNRFMVDADQAACTRQRSSLEIAPPGAGPNETPLKELYFASPRIFYAQHGYPLHFPVANRPEGQGEYPSPGNLIYALTASPGKSNRNALTALCEEAAANLDGTQGLIEEDRVAGRECRPGFEAECAVPISRKTHDLQRINWKLAGFGPIDSYLLPPSSAASSAPGTVKWGVDLAALNAGALILGIDGGLSHDRFEGASVMAGAISGARLHALMATSRHQPAKEDDSISFLVDVIVGLVFLAIWVSIKPFIDMFEVGRSGKALAAVAKATVLAALSLWIGWMYVEWWSPWLLQHFDVWANPAYLLAGLALGAYADVSSPDEPTAPTGWPDFSFGIAKLWTANPGLDEIAISVLALLVCGAGIAALLAMDSGWPAAIASAVLIGFSGWKNRRTA